MKKNLLLLLVGSFTFILFVYFMLPFKHEGFFPTMDDVQVVRIQEMTKELKSGQFPVRYIDSFANGGGYMLFNFYSPLPYYIGSTIQMAGVRSLKATKIIFLLAVLIGSSGIYALLKKYTTPLIGLLGICLFLTSAYFGFDIYERGALAEIWGFVFFPWVIWSLLSVKEKPTLRHILIAGICYALAILSHIAIVFIFTPFILLIVCIPPFKWKNNIAFFTSMATGLLLSCFFWLPILTEQNLIVYRHSTYATLTYKTNFLPFLQLIGYRVPQISTPPPTIGLALFILTLISIIILLWKIKPQQKLLVYYLSGVFITSSLFTLSVTRFIWDRIPQLQFLQAPCRFLTITTIYAIFICGLALAKMKNSFIQISVVLLVIIYAVVFQKSFMRPYTYNNIPEYRAEGVCPTTTWENEYLPIWVKECLPKVESYKPSVIFKNSEANFIENIQLKNNARTISFDISGKSTEIIIRKYYYPSWFAYIDGKQTPTYPSTKYGLITFKVPKGNHHVVVDMKNTLAQQIGNRISFISLLLLFVTFLKLSVQKPVS